MFEVKDLILGVHIHCHTEPSPKFPTYAPTLFKMSMSVNAAQDEFNALLARNRPRSKERRSEDALSTASERSSGRSSPRSSNSSANHRPSTSTGPRPLPRMDGANTGPKGVIADAIAFNKARKNTVRQTFVTLSNTISEKISTPKTQSRGDSRDKDSSTDEDEDDFVRTWRMNRMAELHTGAVVRNRRNSPSKRRWGTITKVTPIGYLDAIERVTADTTVVVFINDEDVRTIQSHHIHSSTNNVIVSSQ